MKRYLIKRIVIAGFALLSVPALFAQDKQKEKDEKQQIVITRDGDLDEKTVIEIKGDKVTVNGKDAKDVKGDVTVRVNKIKDAQAYRSMTIPRGGTYNFNYDNDDNFSFFSEDENRAMLGVVTDYNDKGAKITSVSKESGAEKAGLKKGDVITKIDDQKIDDTETVSKAIRKHKPGDKIAVTVLRDGKEQKITAELGKWKGVKMRTPSPNMEFNAPHIEMPEVWGGGMTFGGAPRLGLSVQDTEDGKGVKVIEVDEDSNAGKAGIKEDDVITHVDDKAVNSATEISKIVRESKDKVSVRFQVLRSGKAQNIEVRIPRKLKTADL